MASNARKRLGVVQQHVASSKKYSAKEWKQRCDLAAAYRIAHHQGWDQVIFNHITLKVDDSDDLQDGPHFLINPFGRRFDEITASSLLKVSISGDMIDDGDGSGPLLKQGFVVHSAVHLARPDIHCIVHNHHVPTVAIAMTTTGLLPLSQEAIEVIKQTSYHPFEGTATDFSERDRMAKNLGPKNKIMILENHGPLTGGSTIEEAFFYMLVVTRACQYQQMAMASVGGDLSKLHMPLAAQVDVMAQRHEANVKRAEYDAPKRVFEAWRREMEDLYGKDNIYK